MQTYQSSAQAAEALRMLSLQADHAATLTFDWVKLRRVLQALIADLKLTEPLPKDQIDTCEKMLAYANHEHTVIRDYAERKSSQCISLNEKIQNGVYPDETR